MSAPARADVTERLLASESADERVDREKHYDVELGAAQSGSRRFQVLLWRVLPVAGVLQFLALLLLKPLDLNLIFASADGESISMVKSDRINMLFWNPHIECYLEQFGGGRGCKEQAFGLITELLTGGTPYHFKSRRFDFATLAYTGSSRGLVPPERWQNITFDCSVHGNGDDVTLLYNAELWTPLEFHRAGCMGAPDHHAGQEGGYTRPFVAQAFESIEQDGMSVLVVGSHFNHPNIQTGQFLDLSNHTLHDAVTEAASRGITNVAVMADTNFATTIPFPPDDFVTRRSRDILKDIGATGSNTHSTLGKRTCCEATVPVAWSHIGYDRVMTNFGSRMTTDVGFTISDAERWHSKHMHLPIVGSLRL